MNPMPEHPDADHWPPYRPVRIPLVEMLCLAGLLVLGYWQVAAGYFQAEDFRLIQNLYDGEGELRWSILPQHFVSQQHLGNFRPLVTFVHLVAVSVFGPDPFAVRGLNLLAHFTNAILLYVLVAKLAPARARFLPLLVAALFVTHPIHPEAVSYISAVSGPACLSLYLAALVFFVNYAQQRRAAQLVASLVLFAAALAMKEEALSLPFVVGLLTVWHLRWPLRGQQFMSAAGLVLPYVLTLALYLGYRYLIFGSITPVFYGQIQHGLPEFLFGLPVYLKYLLSPVNQVVIGAHGATVSAVLMLVMLALLFVLAIRNRPSWWGLIFPCLLFVALSVPYFKVVPFGIYENLLQSRYLYMLSIAAVLLVSWVTFGSRRGAAEPEADPTYVDRFSLVVACGLVLLQLAVLNSNNFAWSEAMRLSAQMREQAMDLSGNDPNVEIVNVPDNVLGALFDRGIAARPYFHPFTAGNFLNRQARDLRVTNTGKSGIRVRTDFPANSSVFVADSDIDLAPGESTRIRLHFAPEAERSYDGFVSLEGIACGEVLREVPVRGAGVRSQGQQTRISASIRERLPTEPDCQTHQVAVSDFADGLDAVDVSIRLPEGAPARLNYWSRDEDRHWVGKNVPITVADGESEHLKVEIIASPGQDAFRVAPLIKAGNASVGTRLPMVLIGDPGPDRPVDVYSDVTYRPVRRSAEGVDVRGACSSARISSREIDFGDLPIQPRGPRAHERIRFGVQPPVQLLWDSQHEVMVPGDAWEEVDVLLDLLRGVDPVWAAQSDVELLQQRPAVIRTVAGKYEKELFFRGLRVPPGSVAYFVFDLKLSNSCIWPGGVGNTAGFRINEGSVS